MSKIASPGIPLPAVLKPEDASTGPLDAYLGSLAAGGKRALEGKEEEQFNRIVVDVLNRGLTRDRGSDQGVTDNHDMTTLFTFLAANPAFIKPIFVSQIESLPPQSDQVAASLTQLKQAHAYQGLEKSVRRTEARTAQRIAQEDKILPSDLPRSTSRKRRRPATDPKPRTPSKIIHNTPKSSPTPPTSPQIPNPTLEVQESPLPALTLPLKERIMGQKLHGTSAAHLTKLVTRTDGSIVVPQDGDGSCFFRSIADSLRFHRGALANVLPETVQAHLDSPNLHEILRTNTVNQIETLLARGDIAETKITGLIKDHGGYAPDQTDGDRNVLGRQLLNLPVNAPLKRDYETSEELRGQLNMNRIDENEVRARTLGEDLASIDFARTAILNPEAPQTSNSVAKEMGLPDKDTALTLLESRATELRQSKAHLHTTSDFLTASRSLEVCAASALTRGLSEILGNIPISIVARDDSAPHTEVEQMRFGNHAPNAPVLCVGLAKLHYEPIFRP